VKVAGSRELNSALQALGKSPGKAVLRRAGTKALAPMRDTARAMVRVDFGDLRDSIKVGTRLSPSQRGAGPVRGAGGGFKSSPKDDVTIHMGPSPSTSSITEEFGKFNEPGSPYMRPAFDKHAAGVIPALGPTIWEDIAKTAARAAKKAAKAGSGG
jgi:hypothetical protein